ncbi:MAG: NifU N-terminal domain-containing protein [Acidimicrobiia bacterium]|nr:NifU N-terminal domain-containing protein [Acidimicrobiia bacterium]
MSSQPNPDLDTSRAAVAAFGLVAVASGHLTTEVAVHLPFEDLGTFKTLLKRFFSTQPWRSEDAVCLDRLVAPHVPTGWWEHDLGGGLRMTHGVDDGRYRLEVSGAGVGPPTSSVFERVFAGPVLPEPTPHPRKVRFVTGGEPSPGVWYRRDDPQPPPDPRVVALFDDEDIADVMVAGDFVTIGLAPGAPWEHRLASILAAVTALFPAADRLTAAMTRDEMIGEGGRSNTASPAELHLLDPDRPEHRARLWEAVADPAAGVRRVAVAVLAESAEAAVRRAAVAAGWRDRSAVVRRTAIDAAAGTGDDGLRPLFERALSAKDAWVRWKAVRAIDELGLGPSREAIANLQEDPDFQVRFEVARVLRPV